MEREGVITERRKPLAPDTELWFGMHKGKETWEVIRDDPSWLFRTIESIDGFEIDNEAFELLRDRRK